MRKIATGLVVKLLLLMLIASFALWGVSDVFTAPKVPDPMIKVGKDTITAGEFDTMYSQAKEQMKRSSGGRSVPNESLIRMGVPQQVLDSMINERLLRQEAATHGVRVSDTEVVRQTHQNPAFYNGEGKFDRQILRQVLSTLNMNESSYAAEMRKSEAQRLFGNSLLGLSILHPALAQSIYLLRLEGRDVSVWVFNQSRLPMPEKPSDEVLKAYYETIKDDYKTQEMRTISLVSFDPKSVEKTPVSDDAIQATYAREKERFTQPETRDVQQLVFKDKADAQAAYELLEKGDTWANVAANAEGVRGKEAQKIQNVLHAKALPGTADAIFQTEKGKFSAPVESPLGWHLFLVDSINPPRVRAFEDVKEEIRHQLEVNAVQDAMDKQIGTLEDTLANGSTLDDAARAANVEVKHIGPFDSTGADINRMVVKELPTVYGVLDRVFALRKGDSTSALTTEDGKTAVIALYEVQLPRHRTLDEVRKDVTSRWQKDEKARLVKEIANSIAAKDGNVGLEASAAQAFNIPLKDVRRITNVQLKDPADDRTVPMPKEMLSAIFSLRPGQHTKAFVLDTGDAAFAMLNAIRPAPSRMTDKESTQQSYVSMVQTVSNELAADYYNLYIDYLKKKYPVKIDQAQYQAIINPAAAASSTEAE